jgi:hypothetical protein
VSSAGGGIAQGVVDTTGEVQGATVSETLIKLKDTIKTGSSAGLTALVFGVIALMLQGVSLGMVRRSDAL